MQSAITEPKPNEAIALREGEDTLTVKGFAWAGGGRAIIRVDVTVDDGKTWTTAALEPSPSLEQPLPFGAYNREWAWRVWTAEVPLPKARRPHSLCTVLFSTYVRSCSFRRNAARFKWRVVRGIPRTTLSRSVPSTSGTCAVS